MALPNFSVQGVFNQTDFAIACTATIDVGTGPNNTIVGWVATVNNGERPNDLTIGGVSATVSSMIQRSTVFTGSTGYMRYFKLVNSSLTGNQTFVCNKVDGSGVPTSVSNMKIYYAVYKDAASITAETVTTTQNTLTPSATVTSPSGELAVWSLATDATRNGGSNSTLTGTSGTTARSGPFNFNEPSVFMDEAGAGSTTLNGTFANVFTPNSYGVVYSFAGVSGGTAPTASTPSNQSVTAGATATFSTTATGTGTLTYQWQRNPTGATSFSDIGGATSSSYTTPTTTVSGGSANNTDTYRVIVTGDTSPAATSGAALLTVTAAATAPTVSTPANQNVVAGSTATFSVTATGSGTLTYQWQRNPTGATTFSNISGATSSSYTTPVTTVSGGSANNTDTYRVIVTGDTAPPATSGAALLTVTSGPANIPFSPRAPYIRG